MKNEMSFMHEQADSIVQQVREQYNVHQKVAEKRITSIEHFSI